VNNRSATNSQPKKEHDAHSSVATYGALGHMLPWFLEILCTLQLMPA